MTVLLRKEESFLPLIFAVRVRVKKSLLVPKEHLDRLWSIRKTMSDTPDFVEKFMRKMKKTKTNQEFFDILIQEWKQANMSAARR